MKARIVFTKFLAILLLVGLLLGIYVLFVRPGALHFDPSTPSIFDTTLTCPGYLSHRLAILGFKSKSGKSLAFSCQSQYHLMIIQGKCCRGNA